MTVTGQTAQFRYKPLYKPNQLLYGTGQTAVVTGWTVKQVIAKHLDPGDYAVIGQLYSPTRGISLLIRNLLANPHVRFLVVLNATKEDRNAGGGQCLLDFLNFGFREGVSDTGRKCWVIESSVPGYIDFEIEADALEKLRQSIEWQEAKSIREAIDRVRMFATRGKTEAWGLPLEFPISQVTPTILPGVRYGHRIEGKTIAETWVKIIHRIKTTGTIRPTGYDGQWQELIDLMAVVTDEPPEFFFPKPNYLPVDRAFIKEYIPQILYDIPEGGVQYTYGQRLRSKFGQDQVEAVINKLAIDIDSARAVMSLWHVEDHKKQETPCLNHIWVRVVENELSLTATFRSNDMYGAWIANAMGLRALQQHIKDEIVKRSNYDLTMGSLITVSQSAHIYDDCWENVDNLIQTQYIKILQKRNYDDPAGSFLISIKDRQILVEHITPNSGEAINHYVGKNARKLYQQIAADCPGIQVEHAMYIGTELQKAEVALLAEKEGLYKQDNPLKI